MDRAPCPRQPMRRGPEWDDPDQAMWEHNLLVKWQQRDAQARGSCSWPGSNRGHLYRQPQVPSSSPAGREPPQRNARSAHNSNGRNLRNLQQDSRSVGTRDPLRARALRRTSTR